MHKNLPIAIFSSGPFGHLIKAFCLHPPKLPRFSSRVCERRSQLIWTFCGNPKQGGENPKAGRRSLLLTVFCIASTLHWPQCILLRAIWLHSEYCTHALWCIWIYCLLCSLHIVHCIMHTVPAVQFAMHMQQHLAFPCLCNPPSAECVCICGFCAIAFGFGVHCASSIIQLFLCNPLTLPQLDKFSTFAFSSISAIALRCLLLKLHFFDRPATDR